MPHSSKPLPFTSSNKQTQFSCFSNKTKSNYTKLFPLSMSKNFPNLIKQLIFNNIMDDSKNNRTFPHHLSFPSNGNMCSINSSVSIQINWIKLESVMKNEKVLVSISIKYWNCIKFIKISNSFLYFSLSISLWNGKKNH